ncbi:MAG: rhodanese-like domain-containing protein [Roseovarius sp.]
MSDRKLSRRAVVGAGLATVAVAGAGAGWALWPGAGFAGRSLSVEQAYQAVQAGDILLVDIRRPDEWADTGIAEGAYPLDMRRTDFADALAALKKDAPDRPVALICARGVRSSRLATQLTEAGFAGVINVPEGMLGSRHGPGWIGAGLPRRMPDK